MFDQASGRTAKVECYSKGYCEKSYSSRLVYDVHRVSGNNVTRRVLSTIAGTWVVLQSGTFVGGPSLEGGVLLIRTPL